MQLTPSVEFVSPIASSDKAIHLSKQRIAEIKHQSVPNPASTSLKNSVTVDQQTAMIVHDMRSPLCVILNVLQACQKMSLDQFEQTRLSLALEEAERLKRMSDEILTHVRSLCESTVLRQEIQLNELIYEIIRLSTDLTVAAGRRIIFVPDPMDGTVKGDRDKLKQTFLNLLTNACEATSPGDVITVHTQLNLRVNQILIRIHNGGSLIPPHLVSVLGYQPVTTKSLGHGLGLMIVRKVIKSHAGILEIESSRRKGTIVHVRLPVVQHSSNPQSSPAVEMGLLPAPSPLALSPCEIKVLQLLVEGQSNLEIAQTLVISINTVKTHVCHLMNKLGVEKRIQVAIKALRMGLVQ